MNHTNDAQSRQICKFGHNLDHGGRKREKNVIFSPQDDTHQWLTLEAKSLIGQYLGIHKHISKKGLHQPSHR